MHAVWLLTRDFEQLWLCIPEYSNWKLFLSFAAEKSKKRFFWNPLSASLIESIQATTTWRNSRTVFNGARVRSAMRDLERSANENFIFYWYIEGVLNETNMSRKLAKQEEEIIILDENYLNIIR